MKVTLHIGTEKTGSSSIQASLDVDRDRLAAAGILYPRLFGSNNHMELVVASMLPDPNDELQLIQLDEQNCTHADYIDRLTSAIASEIRSGCYDRLLLSNEHCHSRLRTPEALQNLLSVIGADPGDVEVIVYLRRQDRLAVSLHSTRIMLGVNAPVFEEGAATDYYYRFDQLLETYAKVFGRSAIKLRLYERRRLIDGDVVPDFYAAAELHMLPTTRPRENVSLSAAQNMFLQLFNQRFPLIDNGAINHPRGLIYTAVSNTLPGPPLMPTKAEAQAFYEIFNESNRRVCAEFFSELETPNLFDLDFSMYPETQQQLNLNQNEMFDFIEAIWRYHNRRVTYILSHRVP